MKLTIRLNHLVKTVLTFLLTGLATELFSQVPDLYTCYREAELLSPLKQQEMLLVSLHELNQRIEQNKYLPDLAFRASGSYQSDVFSLPFSMPGADIPLIPKDQYQLTLNVTQSLYDGGVVAASKQIKRAENEVMEQQLAVSLYQVKTVINDLYFGILTLQANEQIVQRLIDELVNREKSARSGVENGILLPGALKSIRKEVLKAQQQLTEIHIRRDAMARILGDWVGMKISSETPLSMPEPRVREEEPARPELALFQSRMDQLEASQMLVRGSVRPRVMAFVNAGYGSPNSLNFFETDWNSWYIVGGRLEWRFWDWNTSRKQQQVLDLNREIVNTERQNFEKNLTDQLSRQQAEIDLMEQSLETDRQLLQLQEDITETAARQFELGTLSATDYLTELNNLAQARLQLDMHQIALIKAKITFNTLSGNIQ